MQMTEAYAAATTVSIPIFALAAGAEARTIRDRLRRPDERWEEEFARYSAGRELDFAGKPGDVFAYFRDVPGVSKLYVAERAIAIGGAFLWLAVFVLLTIAEIRCLVWLADGAQPGNSGLAVFTLVSIVAAMVMLIVAPTIYLVLPVLMPLDLLPKGLRDAVGPKAAEKQGRGFLRQVLHELEGAIDRASDKFDQEPQPGQPPPEAASAAGTAAAATAGTGPADAAPAEADQPAGGP
jgi:hypothetical protein